jgi:hypothetical protein
MSEKEFELYLSLLSRFLRLSPSQRAEVADELRDHLEERLEELTAQGLTREDAIRVALDEFGEAAELSTHFTQLARKRRRRLIMRLTAGSVFTVSAILLLALFLQPEMPPQNVGARLVAQQAETASDEETTKTSAMPVAEDSTASLADNKSVENKLRQKLPITIKEGSTLVEALHLLSDKLQVDIVTRWDQLEEEGIQRDMQVSFDMQHTTVPAATVLELLLDPIGIGYVVRDGFIYVTTRIQIEEKEEFLETRIYNIRDLLQAQTDATDLIRLVHFANNAAWQHEDGFGGSVTWYDGLLAIRQTQEVHRQIAANFEKLRAAAELQAWGPDGPVPLPTVSAWCSEGVRALQHPAEHPSRGGGGFF